MKLKPIFVTSVLIASSFFLQAQEAGEEMRGIVVYGHAQQSPQPTGVLYEPEQRFTEFVGMGVWNFQNEKLGKIKFITADLENARLVEVVITSGGGFLGRGERTISVPPGALKFDAAGQCTDTPGEPTGSTLCQRIKQRSYPLLEKAGVLFGWFGPEDVSPPPFPAFDCFAAPATHSFAFKGLWNCNWLQAFEVGIDPAHASFLHRFFFDESLEESYGRQFRGASLGELDGQRLPMTKVMREFDQPDISFAPMPYGLQLTSLRPINDQITHTRVTNAIFPSTFVIPLSETMTITQIHVPVDDTRNYWYAIFTSFDAPVDKEVMRNQRLEAVTLPDYIPKSGQHNNWGFSADEQQSRTYLGMGESDINVHDQWACESMGAIQDRTREHLGTTDKVIMANRRNLIKAIETVQAGGTPPGVADSEIAAHRMGPDTVDGLAPTGGTEAWWRHAVQAKRDNAPWDAALKPVAEPLAAEYSPHEEAS